MNAESHSRTAAIVTTICLVLVVSAAAPATAGVASETASAVTAPSGAATEAEPRADLDPVPFGDLAVSNDNLVLYVDNDSSSIGGIGTYTVQTAAPDGEGTVDLLYGSGNAWSSYLTVQVDGTNYVTRQGSSATNMDQYVTRMPTATNDTIVTEWTLPEGVVVTQTISLEGELATFDVNVENTGESAVDVRTRFLFDYQVAGQDGSPVWLEGSVINTETAFSDSTPDSWKTYDQVPTPTLTGQAVGGTAPQPDRIAFVKWPGAYGAPYEYEVDPDAEFYNIEAEDGDSAGLVYFDLGNVASGASASASTQYGEGEPGTGSETLNLVFDDQSTADGESVTVDSVFLPEPGFVGVYDESGTLLGTSSYLGIGSNENISVSLSPALAESQQLTAVPFRDTDGDQQPDLNDGDEPFTADGERITEMANVTVGAVPTADAGANLTVTEGESVSLDGSNSIDPDDGSLTYEWAQTGGPDVSISGGDTATPTFTAPGVTSPTDLTFELTVTDEQTNSDTDTVTVTVTPEDTTEPPTANVIFENQTSDGTTVTVDSVTMSEGGFAAIHNQTDGGIGPVVGVSEYLSAGTHENVEVTLFDVAGANFSEDMTLTENQTLIAMPHLDTNGNQMYDFVASGGEADGPYTDDTGAVVDPAYITIETEEPQQPETVYYQVDFIAGEPLENLSADTLYAQQDRLVRWALGSTDDGITDRGRAWASEDVRSCVDRAGIVRLDDGSATLSFTVNESCSDVEMSLVSYTKPTAGFSPETADQQELYDATTGTYSAGEHTITVDVPEVNSTDGTMDLAGPGVALRR